MISIIVPVYNSEKYLIKCIDSIRNQTINDIEILLINDGSTDNSAEICDNLSRIDKRIKTIHINNGGAANARNIGIKNATGEYIMFADSDDLVSESWCEDLHSCIIQYPNTLPYCSFSVTDNQLFQFSANESKNMYKVSFSDVFLEHNSLGFVWNKIFKKSVIINNNILFRTNKKNDYNEDLLFVFNYLNYCQDLCFINKENYAYVNRSDSLSKNDFCNICIAEKYLEKFSLWRDFIYKNCNNNSEYLNIIANESLYYILKFFKNETKNSILPTKNFKIISKSRELITMINSIQSSNENQIIIQLIKHKLFIFLWIVLSF